MFVQAASARNTKVKSSYK